MTVIAHASGYLPSLLYLAPILIVIGALLVTNIRDRRRGAPGDDPPATAVNDDQHPHRSS